MINLLLRWPAGLDSLFDLGRLTLHKFISIGTVAIARSACFIGAACVMTGLTIRRTALTLVKFTNVLLAGSSFVSITILRTYGLIHFAVEMSCPQKSASWWQHC